MAVEIMGQVGVQRLTDGNLARPSLARDGSLVMAPASGRFREAVLRGRTFSGSVGAAGAAPGTALGTAAAFCLHNPAGSGVRLVVLRASLGYVSGTLGAGVMYYCASTNTVAAVPTGTAVTEVNALLGNLTAGAGICLAAATLPATPTVLRPFCSLGASLASTAVQPWAIMEDVDGEYVVDQGGILSFEAVAAAGTSPLVAIGVTWEEVPA